MTINGQVKVFLAIPKHKFAWWMSLYYFQPLTRGMVPLP